MRKLSVLIIFAVMLSGIKCFAADKPLQNLAAPANVTLVDNSEYSALDNLRFRVRFNFEKSDELVEIIGMTEDEREEKYGSEYRVCDPHIQIDWSLNTTDNWKYNSKWDTLQGENKVPVWEYYITETALNIKQQDHRNILYTYYEDYPEWYQKPWGMSQVFGGLTYTEKNHNSRTVHYLDLNQHTIYAKARFNIKFSSGKGDSETIFVISEWSEVVGVGKAFDKEESKTDDNADASEEQKPVFDAFGPLPVKLNMGSVSQWAVNEITDANNEKLISEALSNLDMSKAITRVEFAAQAVKLYEKLFDMVAVPMDEKAFDDTDSVEASKAKKLGIIQGVSNNNFEPNRSITREEAAVIFERILTKAKANISGSGKNFADANKISSWAKAAVEKMSAAEVIKGNEYNCFVPQGSITREEATVICYRIVNKY